MKKLGKLILSFILVCCCAVSFAACFDDETEKFSKPSGFKFDETTVTVSFNAVDGAESYNAKVTAADKTAVYENKSLKVTKIELKDKKLAAGEYTVTVKVNAVSGKEASDEATYKFSITKTALATPADLAKDGDNVTWTAVEGATNGYSVRIYNKETNIEVLPATTVPVAAFSTETANELVNAQTETLTYVIEVKAIATDNNLESAVATIDWVVKGKILKPTLEATATAAGASVTWTADTRATAGYKAQLYKGTDLVKEYDIAAGTATLEIDRTDAIKGQEYTLKVYGVATDDFRQGDVAEIKFTQSLPAIGEVENLTVNGMVATWDAVEGATAGYSVTVYRKGNEENIKLDAELVAQADAPSIDLSTLAYAAEKDYVVSVVVNAVDGECAASEAVTAEYKSGSVWTFADAEDKDIFKADNCDASIENGKLKFVKQTGNVVRVSRAFKAGDLIEITLQATEGDGYFYIYGNTATNGAAINAFAKIENGRAKVEEAMPIGAMDLHTVTLVVQNDLPNGLYMDFHGTHVIEKMQVYSARNEYNFATEDDLKWFISSGAALKIENGKLVIPTGETQGVNFVRNLLPGTAITITLGNIAEDSFAYGVNNNMDLDAFYFLKDGVNVGDADIKGNGTHTITLIVKKQTRGIRFHLKNAAEVVIENIKIDEFGGSLEFNSTIDLKWFTTFGGELTISDGNLVVPVQEAGSQQIRLNMFIMKGQTITITLGNTDGDAWVYGTNANGETIASLLEKDGNVAGDTDIKGDGTHTITIKAVQDIYGLRMNFKNASAITIESITVK